MTKGCIVDESGAGLTVLVGPGLTPTRLEGMQVVERHEDGSPARCAVVKGARTLLPSPWGELLLRVSDDSDDPEHRRPQRPAVELFPSGVLRAISLETAATVPTSLGPLPAERLLFHANGSLRRVFPLDGKLSAYRTWQDEKMLAPKQELTLPVDPALPEAGRRRLSARCISLLFHPSDSPCGPVASVSLWTGEVVPWPTPVGTLPARIGLSFHENGALASLEPARPVSILSPLGPVTAFDPDPEGISGDANSLAFSPTGKLERLTTASHLVRSTAHPDKVISPSRQLSMCSEEEEWIVLPLTLCFRGDEVLAGHGGLGASGVLPPQSMRFSLREDQPAAYPAPGLPQPLDLPGFGKPGCA